MFDNRLNLRLRPIDWLDILEPGLPTSSQNYSIYTDNAEEDEDAAEDSEGEESNVNDGPVIRPTEDLSTSIDLKEEFPGEIVESGTDSGPASQDSAEGNITRLSLYIVHV